MGNELDLVEKAGFGCGLIFTSAQKGVGVCFGRAPEVVVVAMQRGAFGTEFNFTSVSADRIPW